MLSIPALAPSPTTKPSAQARPTRADLRSHAKGLGQPLCCGRHILQGIERGVLLDDFGEAVVAFSLWVGLRGGQPRQACT
jgi:hypothetical protein